MQLKRRPNLLAAAMKSSRGGRIFGGGGGSRLELPFIFLLCLFFFLAGFFGSSLFSEPDGDDSLQLRARGRMLGEEIRSFVPLQHGSSGENKLTLIPFQVLSLSPRAVYFPNFATVQQCETVIAIAKAGLQPSSVALRLGETKENSEGVRTSSGTFVSSYEDKTGVLLEIEEKIAKATMIPKEHGEAFNVLRYAIGQLYESHFDAFDVAGYGPQRSQRVASFLLYLSDVEEGGETMFPYEGGANMDSNYNFRDCIGLKVKPRQGDGLLFYSLLPNGTIDPLSLHGSCPVIKGQKWVATKWIRDLPEEDYYSQST